MAEILALIRAIPMLLELFQNIGKFLKAQFGDDPAKFLADANDAFKVLNEAKTSEEKIHALQGVQKLLKRL